MLAMMRATYIACLLAMLTPGTALADRVLEVGGFFGGASSNIYTTGPCPILTRAPADECVSNPHYRGRGPVLGALVRYRVHRALFVESNLVYARKGYNDGLEVRLHYVEAPLLVRFDPLAASTTPARLFGVVGLAPAVLVACHTSGQIFINEFPPHEETYSGSCADKPFLDPTPRRFDLGGVLGFGVGWAFGFGVIDVQLRTVRGLVDIDGKHDEGKTVNSAVYVVAGFATYP